MVFNVLTVTLISTRTLGQYIMEITQLHSEMDSNVT